RTGDLQPQAALFIDSVPTSGEDYRIGGTEAPTVRILLEGDRSFVQEVYDYGYIPAMKNVVLS
ncbi:glycoside hydrolase family 68 protein, partial [Pseudomonas amygdali]